MAAELKMMTMKDRAQWRSWLTKNSASSPGIWLVFPKTHTGAGSVCYEDSVCEALCFGWIDSIIKRIDEESYARKYTPRKPTSKWSDANRKRWAKLKAAGLLTEAGLAAAPTENRYGPRPECAALPAYLAKALKTDAKAWAFFQSLAPSYRRPFVMWIDTAKRPETREKRIRESIALLARGEKLGLK